MSGTFTAELHPHASAGSSNGGQFVASGGGSDSATKAKRGPRRRGTHPPGSMYWDPKSNRGTGYGQPGGDRRVRDLQTALNRLHIVDSHGRPLAVDGKLGPKTTSAIKRLQRRLGVKADGVVTPTFLAQLRNLRAAPAKRPAKKTTTAAKRVTQSYDPMQKRGEHGKWSRIGTVLKHIGDRQGSDVGLHEQFGHGGENHSGVVAFHHDGSFSIHSHDGQSEPSHAVTVPGDEAEILHQAVDAAAGFRPGKDKPDEESGDGWRLSWDESGAILTGEDSDGNPTETKLSREELSSLETALGDVKSDAAGYNPLTAVKPLEDGESLSGKKQRFGDGDHILATAAVDGPNGRTVRLAPLSNGDDSPARALKGYTGGAGQSSAVLDEDAAKKLDDALTALTAHAEERRKGIGKAHDAADKPDGYDNDTFNRMTSQWSTGDGVVDGHFGKPVEIKTPWGTVVAQGESDEFGDWTASVGVRPKGGPGEDFSLDEGPVASLEPKALRALQAYLRKAFAAADTTEAVGGAAQLHEYWTRGEGLAKWADSPRPWTALYHHLVKHMPAEEAKRTASNWFHDVFHFWPGSDENRVTHGKPPRGKKIGPG